MQPPLVVSGGLQIGQVGPPKRPSPPPYRSLTATHESHESFTLNLFCEFPADQAMSMEFSLTCMEKYVFYGISIELWQMGESVICTSHTKG